MKDEHKGSDLDKVKELLEAVRNSCEEALDGTWDHTTPEGEKGFEAMIEDIEEAAAELGIDLPPYEKEIEEEEE